MSTPHLVAYVLAGIAIVVMAIDLFLALRLRRALGSGEVGRKWFWLVLLLGIFLAGYVASPVLLALGLGGEAMSVLVFGVFLLGALFVWVVMGILRETLSFLDVLKA